MLTEELNIEQRRFLDKVLIGGRGCWYWTASVDHKGYGKFNIGGKTKMAHQLAYIFWNGEYDHSLYVLHTCDTPGCVNPVHLYLGTQARNLHDMLLRGRGNTQKLKEQQVRCIKKLIPILRNKTLSKWFNINPRAISDIRHNQHWEWLDE